MSKDIKKALEHCIEWNCVDCPNREELGSGETVCRGRLLTDVLEYLANIEAELAKKEIDIITLDTENYSFKQQIDNLRQQLNSQPSDIIKKIKKEFQKHLIDWYEDEENTNSELYLDADWVWEILDTILKEYQK